MFKYKILFLILFLQFLFLSYNFAQQRKNNFKSKEFEYQKGKFLNYRLLTPKKIDSRKKYPLIIFFHGLDERGSNNRDQLKWGIKHMSKNKFMKNFPCFIIAPQCPANDMWVDLNYLRKTGKLTDKLSESLSASLLLLDETIKDSRIDKQRVYISGLSMGGFATWSLISHRPELFAAAIPMSSFAQKEIAERVKNIPLWIFHGTKDRVVPIEPARIIYKELKSKNARVKFTEYKKMAHNCWEKPLKDKNTLNWLFNQVNN